MPCTRRARRHARTAATDKPVKKQARLVMLGGALSALTTYDAVIVGRNQYGSPSCCAAKRSVTVMFDATTDALIAGHSTESTTLKASKRACKGAGRGVKRHFSYNHTSPRLRIMPIMSLQALSRVSTPCMRHVLWRRSGLAGRRFATGQDVPASPPALPLHACKYQRCFCEPHANHANSEKPRGCAQAGIPVGTATSQQLAGRVSPRM